MVCSVYWYIFGTFGHRTFVSFGVSRLNSRNKDMDAMGWPGSQIKYTIGGSRILNQIFG